MTVSHSSTLFSHCQRSVSHKAGERKSHNVTKPGCFLLSLLLLRPKGDPDVCHTIATVFRSQLCARVSDISSLFIHFLVSQTSRQRLSEEADHLNPTGSTLLLCLSVPFWSCGKQSTVGLDGGQFKATETAKLTPRLRGTVQATPPAATTSHVQDADRVLHLQFFRWVAKRSSWDLRPSPLAENQCQACSYRVPIDTIPFRITFTLIIFTKQMKNKNALISTDWNISIFYLLSKCTTPITSTVVNKNSWEMPLY